MITIPQTKKQKKTKKKKKNKTKQEKALFKSHCSLFPAFI